MNQIPNGLQRFRPVIKNPRIPLLPHNPTKSVTSQLPQCFPSKRSSQPSIGNIHHVCYAPRRDPLHVNQCEKSLPHPQNHWAMKEQMINRLSTLHAQPTNVWAEGFVRSSNHKVILRNNGYSIPLSLLMF